MSEENSNKPRILAVDDSRVMRRAMTKVLSADYNVVEAENGEDAWTLLINESDFSIVFTDLSMPFLDGFGLLERIRTSDNPAIADIPVIIITGKEDDDETKSDALDKGANDFITKPFDSVQLKARAKAHVTFKQTSNKLSETSDKLERQATVDETTGLGGQRYFCKVGDEILSYASRHKDHFIIVRMDIDNFNPLFIKHGKENMDIVLKTIGEKLSGQVRQEDTIARIGVSKFGMVLRDTTVDDANVLVERIRAEVENTPFPLNSNNVSLSLTISAAIYEPRIKSGLEFKQLINEAEKYLAKATEAGGNQLVSHSEFGLAQAKETKADVNLNELVEKLKEGKTEELLSQVDAIFDNVKPLFRFLADNAREKFQEVLKEISKK